MNFTSFTIFKALIHRIPLIHAFRGKTYVEICETLNCMSSQIMTFSGTVGLVGAENGRVQFSITVLLYHRKCLHIFFSLILLWNINYFVNKVMLGIGIFGVTNSPNLWVVRLGPDEYLYAPRCIVYMHSVLLVTYLLGIYLSVRVPR